MSEVQAVKKLDTVKLISHLLQRRYSKQMSDVWNIGLNLALRISDLLSIKFDDIHHDRLLIKESKTGKLANIKLNQKALDAIKAIQVEHPDHIYLFQSNRNQQSLNRLPNPLHSMRKTRGYHLYQNTKDIARVMKMLRHGSESVTLRYIGITQDDVDKDFVELEI
jgi:integrase